MDLTRFLEPTAQHSFFSDFWQTKPLFVQRCQAHFYDKLFAVDDIWKVLAAGRYETDELIAVKNGEQVTGYLQDDGTADLSKIRAAVEENDYTLKLMNPERRHTGLAEFCHRLEQQFASPITVGLFLTPPGSVGVDVHFDAVDVLVLQIDGQKVWRIYEPVVKLPSEVSDRISVHGSVGEPILEAVLEPGDFLYVPRGFPHEPYTRDSSSLHISLGVEPIVWSDLLKAGLDKARGASEVLRQRLPLGWLRHGDLDEDAEKTFRVRLTELCQEIDLSTALGDLRSELLGTLHKDDAAATEPVAPQDDLTLDTWMQRRSPLTPQVQVRGKKAKLSFHGGAIQGPVGLEKAFRHIARHERFQISDLGPSVSDNSKLTLVRRLIREGLLVPGEPEAP